MSNSPDYWEQVNTLFYDKYNGIDECHNNWLKELQDTGIITGPFGRFWKIPLINQYGKLNWTQLTNYPVQGTGADVMTIARISFWNRLKKNGLEAVKLVSSVHDSIVVDSPSQHLPIVTSLFNDVFKDLPKNIKKQFDYNWKTPLACEVKYGPNMKDMIKV